MARRCSAAGKRPGITAMDIGMTSAPARPIAARAAIRVPGLSASMPTAEARPNRARPRVRVKRRPKRSPISPAGSITAANTTV